MIPTTHNIDHLITERDLHAYVDGELMPTRRAQVEAYLAARPDEAARVEGYRAQNIGMHILFDRYSTDSLPLSLSQDDNPQRKRRGRGFGRLGLLRKIPALLVAGLFLTTFSWQQPAQKASPTAASKVFLQDASNAYQRFASLGGRVADSGIKPGVLHKWTTEPAVDLPLMVPDLSAAGFSTTGGRMIDKDGTPAAQLVYQNDVGDVVTLYVTRTSGVAGATAADPRTAFTFIRRKNISMFYWKTGAFAYALTGEFERDHLVEIAGIVMDQIEVTPDQTPALAGKKAVTPGVAADPISTISAIDSATVAVDAAKRPVDTANQTSPAVAVPVVGNETPAGTRAPPGDHLRQPEAERAPTPIPTGNCVRRNTSEQKSSCSGKNSANGA